MNEPVRVLQVVTKMYRAGLETVLMNYYRSVDRERLQFDFLVHRAEPGDYEDEIRQLGGRIFRCSPIAPSHFPKYLGELEAFFKQHPYPVVHAHIDSLSTFSLAAARRRRVPVRIAHSHNTSFDRDKKLPLRLLSRALLPAQATHLWGCSRQAARFLFGAEQPAKPFTVLPNAIDLQRFAFCAATRANMRRELGVGDSLVIGHVGRFMQQKNHGFLLEIFSKLLALRPGSILLLVGDGELRGEIEAKAAGLGIAPRVRFLGVRDDIPALLQAMDVFLLPSLFEGMPVVGVEAQAAGLPCVFSETVPAGAVLTAAARRIPLDKPAEVWARALLEPPAFPREQGMALVREQGYDIGEAAAWLQAKYLDMAGGGR